MVSRFLPISFLCVFFLVLFPDSLLAQENAFSRQLKASGYLRSILIPDSADMGYTRWKSKKVIKSRSLPLSSDFTSLQYKGPGVLRLHHDIHFTGEQAIEFAAPSSLPIKNPSNRSYALQRNDTSSCSGKYSAIQ